MTESGEADEGWNLIVMGSRSAIAASTSSCGASYAKPSPASPPPPPPPDPAEPAHADSARARTPSPAVAVAARVARVVFSAFLIIGSPLSRPDGSRPAGGESWGSRVCGIGGHCLLHRIGRASGYGARRHREPGCMTTGLACHVRRSSGRTVGEQDLVVDGLTQGTEVRLRVIPLVEVLRRAIVREAQLLCALLPLLRRLLDAALQLAAGHAGVRQLCALVLAELRDVLLELLGELRDLAASLLRHADRDRVAADRRLHLALEVVRVGIEDDLLVAQRQLFEPGPGQQGARAAGDAGLRHVAHVRGDLEDPGLRGRDQLAQRAVDGAALQRLERLRVLHRDGGGADARHELALGLRRDPDLASVEVR